MCGPQKNSPCWPFVWAVSSLCGVEHGYGVSVNGGWWSTCDFFPNRFLIEKNEGGFWQREKFGWTTTEFRLPNSDIIHVSFTTLCLFGTANKAHVVMSTLLTPPPLCAKVNIAMDQYFYIGFILKSYIYSIGLHSDSELEPRNHIRETLRVASSIYLSNTVECHILGKTDRR